MNSELKPCPFCGGKATLHTDCEDPYWSPSFYDPDSGGNRHTTISCHACHFYIAVYETKEQATKAWNKRTIKKPRAEAENCLECEYLTEGRCELFDNVVIADTSDKNCGMQNEF